MRHLELSFWLFIICLCTSSHSCSISVLLSEYPICLGCLRERLLWDGERAHRSYVQIRWTESHLKWGKNVKASITNLNVAICSFHIQAVKICLVSFGISSSELKASLLWPALNTSRVIWHHYIIVDVSAVSYCSGGSEHCEMDIGWYI